MAGLAAILLIAIIALACGRLTPELVDLLKWVGGSFMAMRAVANVAERPRG